MPKGRLSFFGKNKHDLSILLIILLIFWLVYTSFQIVYSIHTVDTAYNFVNLGNCLNKSITDIGSDFIERNLVDYYIIGMNDLKRNILMSIILSMLIIYLIMDINNEKRK